MQVYGPNVLKELNKDMIQKVYTSRKEIVKYCEEEHIKYEFKDNNFLNKLCNKKHQGVVINVYEYKYFDYSDVEGDFVVVLDHLEDPHNFGAIIRTSVAAGIKTMIIPKDRSVLVTDTVMKTSAGMLNHIKVVMVNNIVDTLKKLKKDGYFIYSSDMNGENYKTLDYSGKRVLVVGNEGKGVSRLVKENSDFLVKIPMNKVCESLNASVAAGILIFEMSDKNE